MATPAIGAHGELLVEPGASTHTFNSSSERYEILRESIQAVTGTIERDGFRGSRSLRSAHVKNGVRAVGGSISINPSPADLDFWLPRVMRLGESANVFALGDSVDPTVIKFGVMIDRVTDNFTYTDCQVARATFRGSPGQLLELQLDIIGLNELTENLGTGAAFPTGGDIPAWNDTLDFEPYVYHEGALVLDDLGTADDPFDFELVIDNAMSPRFVMSQTATEISPADSIITLTLTCPYDTDHRDLYRASEKGVPDGGTLTFTNATLSTVFTFQHLRGGDASPTLNSKGELRFGVPFRARASGTETVQGILDRDELSITNDSTV